MPSASLGFFKMSAGTPAISARMKEPRQDPFTVRSFQQLDLKRFKTLNRPAEHDPMNGRTGAHGDMHTRHSFVFASLKLKRLKSNDLAK
jgi:hypothetical protein